MFVKNGFILLLCCCYFGDGNKETYSIDVDYYLSYLRNANCYTKEGLRNCEKGCHNVPVTCHDGECYCHQSVVEAIGPSRPSIAPRHDVQVKKSSQMASSRDTDVREIMLTEEALRPALRHQIAHFCPDLEVARKCIRTCIKEGKPAFCGKDHVCYCGHKYGPNDSNNKQNALDVYKEFADMYAKYLANDGNRNYDDNEDNKDEGEN